MTNKHAGWMLFAASMATVMLLLSADVKALHSFNDALTPAFIGSAMAHVGNVVMAFVGGKLIPTEPHTQREGD